MPQRIGDLIAPARRKLDAVHRDELLDILLRPKPFLRLMNIDKRRSADHIAAQIPMLPATSLCQYVGRHTLVEAEDLQVGHPPSLRHKQAQESRFSRTRWPEHRRMPRV